MSTQTFSLRVTATLQLVRRPPVGNEPPVTPQGDLIEVAQVEIAPLDASVVSDAVRQYFVTRMDMYEMQGALQDVELAQAEYVVTVLDPATGEPVVEPIQEGVS